MKTTLNNLYICVMLLMPLVGVADAFNDIVSAIVCDNPQLKYLDATHKSELQLLKAENSLDDPEIEAERLWSDGTTENRWSIGVSQSFKWPLAYSVGNKAISVFQKSASLKFDAARAELSERVSLAIIAYIEAKYRADLLYSADDTLNKLADATKKAFDAGEATILDVNHVAVEAAKIGANYADALTVLTNCLADLESLGYDARTMPPLNIDMPVYEMKSDEEYYAAALQTPKILAAEAEVEQSNMRIKATQSALLPGFTLGYKHAYEDGFHFNGLVVGMSLPIWRASKQLATTNSERMAAAFQAEAVRTEALARVRALTNTAHSLQMRIRALAPPVENSNNQALLQRAYEGGQISLSEYLTESNYFLDARLLLIGLHAEFARTMAQLDILIN